MMRGPRKARSGFFLRAETAMGLLSALSGVPGYWSGNTDEMSHGEGFLTAFDAMFARPGFYVLDEPESALSFTSSLRLVELFHRLARTARRWSVPPTRRSWPPPRARRSSSSAPRG